MKKLTLKEIIIVQDYLAEQIDELETLRREIVAKHKRLQKRLKFHVV